MRELSVRQAADEVEALDRIRAALEEGIRSAYDEIRARNPRFGAVDGDIEVAANLHNRRRSHVDALEELARRGYGRVAVVQQINDAGEPVKTIVYRVSQANANLPNASVLARNGPLGSAVASCSPGEEFEVTLPNGERYYIATSLIELEGAAQLLRPEPEIKIARFRVADIPEIDVIRNVRAFVKGLPAEEPYPSLVEAPTEKPDTQAKPFQAADAFWPTDWSKVILADEPDSALSAQFFTKTTLHQEEAIKAVRGVIVVHGIAGTGKTSVALGRLKFLANFRSGEHLEDHGLDPNDWADFDSRDMIGFVLSPSLVQYLKQTAEDLELHMKIIDFEEFRNQERQSRRLFGRPFKRSPEHNSDFQHSMAWLRALADASALELANSIEATYVGPLAKPDTPDGTRIVESRWQEIETFVWRNGPLRSRLTAMVQRLKRSGSPLRIQGIANVIDSETRLSDVETAPLTDRERRAVREAVLNVSLRLFRLLNPSELYVTAHEGAHMEGALNAEFGSRADGALSALAQTRARLRDRLVTDGDVVAALSLNALICDRFVREIKDIPYLISFSDRVGVFIDEYQDFTEQQVFLMGMRAKRKYRQITVSGDKSQRLRSVGVTNLDNVFPYVSEPIRQRFLNINFRQTEPLARLSNRFRAFTDDQAAVAGEPCGAPVYLHSDRQEFAQLAAAKISALPETASVVIVSPNSETVETWFELLGPALETAFRSPIISDRARLTERLKTHFTTSREAKGLEFDVAVVPDISEFRDDDLIELNGLYVAVSRPRHAIMLGCRTGNERHLVMRQLCKHGDLVPQSCALVEGV